MNVCKNKCEVLVTKHYNMINKYLTGYMKCRTCCICIKTEEYKCPCCKRKLSTRRIHNYKNRRKEVD